MFLLNFILLTKETKKKKTTITSLEGEGGEGASSKDVLLADTLLNFLYKYLPLAKLKAMKKKKKKQRKKNQEKKGKIYCNVAAFRGIPCEHDLSYRN